MCAWVFACTGNRLGACSAALGVLIFDSVRGGPIPGMGIICRQNFSSFRRRQIIDREETRSIE